LEQIGIVPACVELLAAEAALAGGVLFEEVQGEAAESGEVFGGIAGAGAALILAEDHVHEPMHLVLHAPVAADGSREGLDLRNNVQIVAPLGRWSEGRSGGGIRPC